MRITQSKDGKDKIPTPALHNELTHQFQEVVGYENVPDVCQGFPGSIKFMAFRELDWIG